MQKLLCLSIRCQENYGNSLEHDQKLIRLGEVHNEFVYHLNLISIRSEVYLQMDRNCSTNQRPGNSGNSVENDQRLIRLGRVPMSLLTKFELNPISSLFENVWNLFNQSEARKRWAFSRAWPKVNQAGGGPQRVCSPNLLNLINALSANARKLLNPPGVHEMMGIQWSMT